MYRKASSGRFIGLTTFGIVVVMAVFTWVMYGMAQQVIAMADIMYELSDSFKAMIAIQEKMAVDIHAMSINISSLSGDISSMDKNVGSMSGSVGAMSGSVGVMTDAMRSMATNMGRMTYDISQASYAMSNPMSYMWGNSFPF